jgi:tRNA G18 (ribose-2'-O)-methylase SpoU
MSAMAATFTGPGPKLARVSDLGDPRLDDYRNLRDRDLSRERAAFIVESELPVRVLLERSHYPVRSLLLAEGRLERFEALLARLEREVPVLVAPARLMDQVVGFPIHRGVLAAAGRLPVPAPDALLASLGAGPRLVVALEGLTNHDNVGGVYRNAAAFGADAVLLDARSCDPLYRKAVRVSLGAALFVPWARARSSAALRAALRAAGFANVALTPRRDASDVAELGGALALAPRTALWLGSEGPGLSDETLAEADERVRIDIAAGCDALNVATAAGVALHCYRSARARSW